METVGSPLLWAAFLAFVLGLLALDLGVFHRRAHAVHPREALGWSLFWIVLALGFNALVWRWFGPARGLEFLTGYLIEKALSVDNIFVFLVIFSYFGVPAALQHRVLFWGIIGAIITRMAFILAGAALLSAFHWVIYVFGLLLIVTGLRMLRGGEEVHPERNHIVRLARRFLPVVPRYHGAAFFVHDSGRQAATPLFLALLTVEATDIVFAVDSIPAIFAITQDPFIVFTSNLFAILGLRALYFLLAGILHRFHYLKVGLSLVLVFVGMKMLISEAVKVPIGVSLAVVALLIGGAVVASLLRPVPEPIP
ncbi:MAG TPA: TerC family protein [bacterium]|nr:TerC family protein [bacterium]